MDWFKKKEQKQRNPGIIDLPSVHDKKGKERTKFLSERGDRRRRDIPGEHLVPIVLDGAPGVPHSRALTSGESGWCDICGGFYLPHQHE